MEIKKYSPFVKRNVLDVGLIFVGIVPIGSVQDADIK
jgi:hypothetical protein